MKRHIRLLSLLLAFLLLAGTLSFPVRAAGLLSLEEAISLPPAPEIQSQYAILVEMKSGTILYEKNARERAWPASTTKILTALLTVENCQLDESVTFSYRATHELGPGSSHIARTENEVMTVEECLYGMMVASANEVAQGLAEHISGSFESFASLMTLRAYELGAVNSNFANPHGYHDESHYTCAYDLALIMGEAMQHEVLRTIMGTEKYQIPPTNKHDEITYLQMKHPLLSGSAETKYAQAVAGKTGYTEEAGNTLVTYARQGDLDLICVVMHAPDSGVTREDSVALFNYGFDNFHCMSLSSEESVLQSKADHFLSGDLLRLSYASDAWCTLPKDSDLSDLRSEVILMGGREKDSVLATRIYYLGDQEVGRCLLTASPVEEIISLSPAARVEPSRNEVLRQVYLGLPLIYWILIGGGLVLLLLLLLLFFLIRRILRQRRRRQEQAKRALNRIAE